MADVKLLGEDEVVINSWTSLNVANYIYATRYLALAGELTRFNIRASEAGKYAYVGIYTDVGGVPGALISPPDTRIQTSVGWGTVEISPTPLSAGNYWLALVSNSGRVYRGGTTYTTLRKTDSSYGPLPISVKSWTNTQTLGYALVGYGTLASGGAGRLIGSGDPTMIHVGHPKMIHVANPSLIRARGG